MAEGEEALSLLFGADPAEGLVGCARRAGGISLWWRRGGAVQEEEVDHAPYFLLSHRELLDDFKPSPRIDELSGDSLYRFRVSLEDWPQHDEAAAHVNRIYRAHKADFTAEPLLRFGDPVNQYLLSSGRTHFKQLDLHELNVLYIALRAYNSDSAEYADPEVAEDRIVLVGLSDGRSWQEVVSLDSRGEAGLIGQLGQLVRERDPDVIVGHNLFKGAMHYLSQRAKRHRLKLEWGRDGSPVNLRKSRAPAAEKQLEYPRADVAGRHLVDTWFLAQYYDIVKRDLERYDAPYVARYLDRTSNLPDTMPPWAVDEAYDTRSSSLLADLKYELEAAAIIYRTLIGSYFAQAQMLPLSLQDTVVRGNGMKINYLMLREYLRRGESIPAPAEARAFPGGHTEIRQTGLIENVLNVDIASLYPSIMLKEGVKPRGDTGGVFQPLLSELTRRRLADKQLARTSEDVRERVRADARQAALKIFINSFFGYLGTDRMNWADPDQAEFITRQGQDLVRQLAAAVEEEGGAVIEIDTDGVYFTAPRGLETTEQRETLARRINTRLPAGIEVELGGFYPAMLSHKVKNYALLDEDGKVTIKGSGLKSRGLEPFLHKFIGFSLGAILRGREERITERYAELEAGIQGHDLDIRELAKTDTLIETLEAYQEKVAAGKRNRAAAYEVALGAKRRLRPGDQVSYYITGEKATVKAFEAARPLRAYDPGKPDYNVAYYLRKLRQNLKKVRSYVGEDEAELFGEE